MNHYQQPAYQPQNNQQPPQQQPVAQPFTGSLDVSDAATPIIPDGQYQLRLARVEMYQGKKFQSEELQNKLRFVFLVLNGAEQGKEVWNIENLPEPGKPIGPKHGIRKFLELLRGRPLVDGEQVQPGAFIGTEGWAQLAGGKFHAFMPMDFSQQSPVQAHSLPQQPLPQQDAYAEPIPQSPPPQHAETQQQAVERI